MKFVFGYTNSNISVIRITFDAGSSVEYGKKWTPGLAHLAEHMVFQNSKHMPPSEAAKKIATLGANWNAFTSHNRVTFFVEAPCENLEEVAKILRDTVLDREIKIEDFEKEKLVILEEERGSHDEIENEIFLNLYDFLCKGPLAVPILGTSESIASITLDELKSFYNTYYQSKHMIVTITSNNLEHESLGKLFGKPSKFQLSEKESNIFKNKKKAVLYGNVQQARVFICYKTSPIKHKNTLDIQVIEEFFSNGMDTRLFHELRDVHGLCYNVGSFLASYRELGWLTISVYTGEKNVEDAIRIITNEIKNLVKYGPSDEELTRAKNKIIAKIYKSLENSYGLNSTLDFRTLYNLPDIEKSINRVKNVSSKRIKEVCFQVFNPKAKQIFIYLPEEKSA